jgi:hypothetical protein
MAITITRKGLSPAFKRAQADADLAAGADQACASGMGLTDQLDRLSPMSGAGQPSAPSEQKASYFSQHQQGRHFGHGLLLALELLLEGLDLPLVLRAELLQLLLLFQGQRWLLIGILGGLPLTLHLLRVQAPFPEVGAELGGFQPSALEHHPELVGSTPAIRVFFGCRHHLSLQSPRLPPVVEGYHVNAQLL